MNKPNVGDKVTVALYIESMEFPDVPEEVTVTAVFDNLTEDWGIYGECAMAQGEVDELTDKTGDWYIVFDDDTGTCSAASYEVVDAPSE